MDLEDITVIVPTRNEENNIPALLGSLPAAVRLIVIDDSQDSTPALVESLRPGRSLVLRCPAGVSQARQLGAELAETAWLLFSDADVIFAPHYFAELRRWRSCGALYGPKLSIREFESYYRWFARGQRALHWLGIPAASGSNLLVSRHALFAVGGFDLQLACNEDTELVWRIKRWGYPVVFAPDLIVYAQDHRRLRWGWLRKTWHSLTRGVLLYYGLMPARWRSCDWGYWSHARDVKS